MKRKVWLAIALGVALASGAVVARKVIKGRHPAAAQSAVAPAATVRVAEPLEVAEMVYEGRLGAGWDDWGWGPHQLGKGPAKVVFASYGGIMLHHAELPGPYGGVSFRYKAPEGWRDFLQVSLRWVGVPDDSNPTVRVEPRHELPLADGWREVLIDWKELNPEGHPFDRLVLSSHSMIDSDWVLLDRVLLTKAKAGTDGAPTAREVTLSVSCDGRALPISEMIYGGSTDAWSSGQTAQRIGGNPLTRANWELPGWNLGKDWYFENVSIKQSIFEMVGVNARLRRKTAVVVPMIGWVAKDDKSVGFPRSIFGEQGSFDPYKSEAGNGQKPDGTPITPGPPSQTSMPAPPDLIEKWVRQLVADDAARGWRGVQVYILDNEPSLWNVTHRDVHPEPLSYDQLLERTIAYATAIRNADPSGLIAGPAEWGWLGYETSAVDREAGNGSNKDRLAHGDMPLVAWYLKKLAEHERATGTRLLDVLDLHFYPAAGGMFGDNARTDLAGSELRLRSTRALWDETYKDESWIAKPIALIPRMKRWVNENYPGRKIMIGEWNFGGEAHISGGLATAEALGRFGQQGVDAAFFWGSPKPDVPLFWAFRAFRDFDGKGARFEDFSLPVREADKISLFASRNEDKTRVVLVLVNREPSAQVTANVTLQACGDVASSRLFSYGPRSKALAPGVVESTGSGVRTKLEPFSFGVVELLFEKN